MDRVNTWRGGRFLAAAVTALACLVAAAGASAKTYRVTQHADPAPTGCTKHDCSLREAINAANAHPGADIVGLRGGNYKLSRPNLGGIGENNNDRGDLDVTDPVTIEHIGKGRAKIDADGLDRVLSVVGPGNATKLLKLKIIGGKNPAPDPVKRRIETGSGGGLLSYDSPLTLVRCAVIGNQGADSGGGIEADGGLTMNQVIVSNNSTNSGTGGGIFAFGEPVKISLSTIDHNHSANAGGGIALDTAALHMKKTTVSANVADAGAAGVYLYQSPASTIDATTINNNVGHNSDGGGLEVDFSTLTVTNSTIASNQADFDGAGIRASGSTISGNGLTITQNRADHDTNDTGLGGGIHTAGGTFNLANSIVAHNRAGNVPNDCTGAFSSGGGNVIQTTAGCTGFGGLDVLGKDAKLAKLDTNGGPTRTIELENGSPAIGAAIKSSATTHDQRGQKRDKHPDSGAVER